MNTELNSYYNDLHSRITDLLTEQFQNRNSEIVAKLDELEALINNRKHFLSGAYNTDSPQKIVQTDADFKSALENVAAELESIYLSKTEELMHVFEEEDVENLLENYKPVTKVQHANRFKMLKNDPLQVKIIKAAKIAFFQISRLPARFSNLVRHLFRKKTKNIKFWNHTISVNSVLLQNVVVPLLNKLKEIELQFAGELKSKIGYLQSQLNYIEVNPKCFIQHKAEFDQWAQAALNRVSGELQKTIQLYEAAFAEHIEKSGTIELPDKYLKWKSGRSYQISRPV